MGVMSPPVILTLPCVSAFLPYRDIIPALFGGLRNMTIHWLLVAFVRIREMTAGAGRQYHRGLPSLIMVLCDFNTLNQKLALKGA